MQESRYMRLISWTLQSGREHFLFLLLPTKPLIAKIKLARQALKEINFYIKMEICSIQYVDRLRLDRSTALYIYKAKNCKLLVLFTQAQKTKFVFQYYIKTLFSKDLFLIINYWNIEDSWKWAILWSKMPFLVVLFVWDKNFFSKSCKVFFNAHYL